MRGSRRGAARAGAGPRSGVMAMATACLIAAGCAAGAVPARPGPTEEAAPGSAADVAESLVCSLDVKVTSDSVRLLLHVTNAGAAAVRLGFPTAQRYEFEVRDSSGSPAWRWSDGRAFAQANGSLVLEPGQSRTYTAAWRPSAAPGEYRAVGRLTTADAAVVVERSFVLPPG